MNDESKEPVDSGQSESSSKLDQFFTGRKKYLPMVILVILAVIAAMFMFGVFDGDDAPEEPEPTPPSSSAPVDPTTPSSPEPSEDDPTEPPAETETPVEDSAVQEVAEDFVAKLYPDKGGKDWANSVKGITNSALYESLKVAEPKTIPTGASTTTISGNGPWTGVVKDADNQELFTITIKAHGPEGEQVPLVTAINIPASDEVTYDDEGHPIPAPVMPFSDDSYEGLYSSSNGVAKTYLEFNSGDSKKDREAKVKGAVNDGKHPALRDYTPVDGGIVKMYAPRNIHALDATSGDSVSDGKISIQMYASYADYNQADPKVVEEITLIVDFTWDKTLEMWKPTELRLG